MQISPRDHLIPSDVFLASGETLVVRSVLIGAWPRREPNLPLVAGARLFIGDPDKECCLSVIYHFGRSAWHLQTEYVHKQMATRYEADTLAGALLTFERRVGVTLPPIKVMEPGVGIYVAQGGECTNPWALQDGMLYSVTDKKGKVNRYLAKVNSEGVTRVASMREDGPDLLDTEDPRKFFTTEQWMSLTPIDPESAKMNIRTDNAPINPQTNRNSLADEALASYNFGADVKVLQVDGWNCDDPDDWTCIVYVAYSEDPPEADSHKVSFHVRFGHEGKPIEIYGLETEHGNYIGAHDNLCLQPGENDEDRVAEEEYNPAVNPGTVL
jgi:hypothetical protein